MHSKCKKIEIRKISSGIVQKIQEEIVNRLDYSRETNGWLFEHLIRLFCLLSNGVVD